MSISMLAAGCGGGAKTFDVATYSLAVADEGYFMATDNAYCSTGSPGQMLIDFVDYDFLCDPTHQPARDNNVPHTELRIILNIGNPPTFDNNYPGTSKSVPYPIQMGDCTNGIGADQAQFLHYPAMSTTPDMTIQADSGSVSISQFDITKVKPLMGQFDLKFGNKEVKDTFKVFSCN
jgi:hypothetical protein